MSPKKKSQPVRRKQKSAARKPGPRKRSAAHRKRSLWSRVLRLGLMLGGIALGLLIPWTLWLNHLVVTEFEGRKWDLPSRVYARPLSLYEGLEITPQALEAEMLSAGYQKVADPGRDGSFSANGGQFEIIRRGFRFEDGVQQSLRFRLRIAGGRVTELRGPGNGAALGLVRLDPAEIASIYPLDDEDRTLISATDVPELLLTGLQAVEDRQFKHHHGIDPRGIARALLADIRAGKAVQGGSTLTQQLVKNYYLSDERTLIRKANEALMSVLLEWHYDKTEILEAYLNEIFLGQQGRHAIHGFGRASEFYFGVPVKDLRPEQVALLVGMVRGASLYNPRRNAQRATERRNQVLEIFRQTGLLTDAEAKQYASRPLGITAQPDTGRSRYPAFVELVREQLRRDYDESDLRSEGLRIFTTLAPSEQQAAERAMSEGLKDLHARGMPAELQGALVLADVDSGEVRAVVGDRDGAQKGFNRALNARRQVGSVIKPLVYLLALEHQQDYNLLTRVRDEPITLRQADGSDWTAQNYDRISHGEVTLLEALVHSYNQATVRVGMNIGVAHLLTKLQQLGVIARTPAVPAALLGAIELTPLEVTQVYQSLAAGGYSVPLRAVTAVQTAAGSPLNRYPLRMMPLERRDAIAVLNYALTRVVSEGTARELPALLGSDLLVAGKTGTTNERRDSWFVGYTRNRVGVVWVGRDDNGPAGVTGSNAAMRVWAGLFRQLPLQPVSLDMPEGAFWMWVEADSGTRSDERCPGSIQMAFVAGSEPTQESACLARLDRRDKQPFWRQWFERKN